MFDTAIRFFQDGGFFMYPISIVLLVGVIIAIERYVYLTMAKRTNRGDFDKLHRMISGKDLKSALKYASDSGSARPMLALMYTVSREAAFPRRQSPSSASSGRCSVSRRRSG